MGEEKGKSPDLQPNAVPCEHGVFRSYTSPPIWAKGGIRLPGPAVSCLRFRKLLQSLTEQAPDTEVSVLSH